MLARRLLPTGLNGVQAACEEDVESPSAEDQTEAGGGRAVLNFIYSQLLGFGRDSAEHFPFGFCRYKLG